MPHLAVPPRLPPSPGALADLLHTLVLLCLALAPAVGWTQLPPLRGPAPGLCEAGAPDFTVHAPAAIGLSTAPSDLHRLPDGRILALAGREIAMGDGTRWEVIRLSPDEQAPIAPMLIVDDQGRLYSSADGHFVRIEFGADGYWHRVPLAPIPDGADSCTSAERFGDRWLWHANTSTIIDWKPGQPPTTLGTITDLERLFLLGETIYASNRADASFWRVATDRLEPVVTAEQTDISLVVTSGTTLASSGLQLVGTHAHGLQRFNGSELHPFLSSGPLSGSARINDLCEAGPGIQAAAVNNLGIVLFDSHGRLVQMLDRSLDHRIARVRKLLPSPQGSMWALLNDGVARVSFPSPLTSFESLVATGLVYARPCRFEGRLWLLSDGQAQRGIYDHDGRLIRFEVDSPPEQTLCGLSSETGDLLASARDGIHRRTAAGWEMVAPGVRNAHLCQFPDADGRWSFFAEASVGWIRRAADGTYETHRQEEPGTGNVYGAIGDRHGALWAELGTARLGRFTRDGAEGEVRYFGLADGLVGGWSQLWLLDGEIRVTAGNQVLRFDPQTRRFQPDEDLLRHVPQAADVVGRPAIDSEGRLWLATTDRLLVFAQHNQRFRLLGEEQFPSGLVPLYIDAEAGGVVWLHRRQNLARFDPAVPRPRPSTPRALITSVQLTNSNRSLFLPGSRLPSLKFDDNSLVVHFAALDAPPGQTVTFEFRLQGGGGDWVDNGVTGWAQFNQLKEGDYTLQLRPVAQGSPGEPVELRFKVDPPWFRTRAAYAAYSAGAIALIGLVGWYSGWRARRDKAKLARLVALRTHELDAANRRLETTIESTRSQAEALRLGEERFRQLSTELERRVRERTEALVRANQQLVAGNQELESFSYSISHDLRAPLRNINGFIDLLQRRTRGQLDAESVRFFRIISTETIRLSQLIDSLLAFARLNRAELRTERVSISAVVTQVIAELRPEFENRLVDWRIGMLPTVVGDAALLRQVIANLLNNAIKFTRPRSPAIIEIGARPFDDAHLQEHILFVRDNGVGFDAKYSAKLFGVFQRLHHTRDFEGTGIGLANAKRIVLRHGGRMWAEGMPGEGATFFFSLPVRGPAVAPELEPSADAE